MMNSLSDDQCRRCGHIHENTWQILDPAGRWAVVTVRCQCGHTWTVLYTAPANLRALRTWVLRGCRPEEEPAAVALDQPWHAYRLEGVCPSLVAAAS